MKKILLIITFFSLNVSAVEVSFIGPCSLEPLLKVEHKYDGASVGLITVETLEKEKIEFIGSQQGLASAFGTPTGKEAMEILGPDEIRAYGWGFSLNGFSPAEYPHRVQSHSNSDKIEWLFGYAHYKDGQWLSQCDPAHLIAPDFLCKE